MKHCTIAVLTILFIHCSCQNSYSSFIVHYMEEYEVPSCYLITCQRDQGVKNITEANIELIESVVAEVIKTSKMLSLVGIKSASVVTLKAISDILRERNITKYGFVLNLSCRDCKDILNTRRLNLRLTRPWLILAPHFNTSESYWQQYFKDIQLRLDSNVKIAIPQEPNSTQFKLLDVYNPGFGSGGEPVVTESGLWNGTNLLMYKNVSYYMQRKNMSSVLLRNAAVVLKTDHAGTFEEYMLDSRLKQYDTQSKFHYPQFLILQRIHNFSYNLTFEGKWYGDTVSGIDDGIARLLHQDLIDISCTGGAQRFSRVDFIDYLMPSYHFRPLYIFRNPGISNYISGEFLKPFSKGTWYVFIVAIAALCIFLRQVYNLENRMFQSRVQYSWATILLMTLAPLLQQESHQSPTHFTSRCVYLALLTLSILLYNYYTSSILSSLLSSPKPALQTLDELAHSSLDVGIEDLPYTITWFIITNASDTQYIYKNKVYSRTARKLNIYPPEEGIAKVAPGGFAYHTQADTGYSIIEKTFDQDSICDLYGIPMLPQTFGGVMVQKKSQYYELFQITLWKARQAGLIKRISLIWEAKKPECLSSVRVIPVGMSQTFMAFFSLIVGMIISAIILFIERKWEVMDSKSKLQSRK